MPTKKETLEEYRRNVNEFQRLVAQQKKTNADQERLKALNDNVMQSAIAHFKNCDMPPQFVEILAKGDLSPQGLKQFEETFLKYFRDQVRNRADLKTEIAELRSNQYKIPKPTPDQMAQDDKKIRDLNEQVILIERNINPFLREQTAMAKDSVLKRDVIIGMYKVVENFCGAIDASVWALDAFLSAAAHELVAGKMWTLPIPEPIAAGVVNLAAPSVIAGLSAARDAMPGAVMQGLKDHNHSESYFYKSTERSTEKTLNLLIEVAEQKDESVKAGQAEQVPGKPHAHITPGFMQTRLTRKGDHD